MNSLQKTLTGIIFLIFSLLLFPLKSYSQTSSENKVQLKQLMAFVETKYQLDDLLVNGSLYRPMHIRAKGSPYFLSDNLWKNGIFYIKGRQYSDQDILYNIATNQMVTKIYMPDGSAKNIIIENHFIDSVIIETHFFINIAPFTKNKLNEIYEQAYNGNIKGLIKHVSTHKRIITNETPDGYYEEPEKIIFLLKDKEMFRISGKKSLLTHFSAKKKQITRYMRQQKIRLKKAEISELYNLFKYCDDLTEQAFEE